MIKMMKELKRHEIMRRIEQQDADQQREPSPSLRDEAATRSNSPSVRDEAATRKSRLAESKKTKPIKANFKSPLLKKAGKKAKPCTEWAHDGAKRC